LAEPGAQHAGAPTTPTLATPRLAPAALAKKFIFPALLVAALLGVAFFVIDMRRLGALLLQARLWPLAALLACHLASLLLHTLRQHVLMRRAVPLGELFHANNICNMVNSVLPFRAGEFAMALALSRRASLRGTEILSMILVDRLLGLLSILTIFLATLPGFSPHGAAAVGLVQSGSSYLLAFGAIVSLMLLATLLEERLVALARAVLSRLPLPVESIVERLRAGINGLRVLFHLRTSLPAFALALSTWGCIIALNYWGMRSVSMEPTMTAAVFVTFLTVVGIMLVPTPSGLGTVHGASVLVLSMFGVGAEQALAFAILAHALVTMTNIGLGLLSARRMDFHLGRVLETKAKGSAGPA
jgi:hypothetical protein